MCFENDNGDSEIWTCRTLWTWSCGIITASRCCINTRRPILLEKISLVCAGVRRIRTFWQWHMACTISSHSQPGKMVMLAFGISKQVFPFASLRSVNDKNLMISESDKSRTFLQIRHPSYLFGILKREPTVAGCWSVRWLSRSDRYNG